MKALDPTASVNGDVTIDVWTRKSDYRPAKIAIIATSPDIGTFGTTFDLKYDVPVSVDAPPADQVAPRSPPRPAADRRRRSSPRRGPDRPIRAVRFRRPEGPGEGPRPTMARCHPRLAGSGRTAADDAPTRSGTRFGESRTTPPRPALAEPDWMREAPDPGGPAGRAHRGRAAGARGGPAGGPRSARADARAKEIVGRLNPEQARAVTTTDGPLLILAGAGSGKTRVLAHRIAYLSASRTSGPGRSSRSPSRTGPRASCASGSSASSARPAATSRRARSTRSAPASCARDGEAIGIDRRFVDLRHRRPAVADEADPARGGPAADRRVPAERGPRRDQPGQERDARPDVPRRERGRTTASGRSPGSRRATRSGCGRSSALDFDDLLLEAVRLFEEAPDVLARTRSAGATSTSTSTRTRTAPQYLWIRALAAQAPQPGVVGDDDQSIYSWRGADLRNILDFERD